MTEPGNDELLATIGEADPLTGVQAEKERIVVEESMVLDTPPADDEPGRQYPPVDASPDSED